MVPRDSAPGAPGRQHQQGHRRGRAGPTARGQHRQAAAPAVRYGGGSPIMSRPRPLAALAAVTAALAVAAPAATASASAATPTPAVRTAHARLGGGFAPGSFTCLFLVGQLRFAV